MGGRVLVIDDDDDTCVLVEELLRSAGYEAELATDPRRAVEAFSERRHDVVVTDVRMPGMDGLEVLRAIKGIEPDVPVIIFSAAPGDRARLAIEALRGGAADFLIKPLSDLVELRAPPRPLRATARPGRRARRGCAS
jgi:DNA-binding NtrC family response regulator